MNLDPISEDLDDLASDTRPCPACGHEIWDQADRCPHCGEFIIHTHRASRPARMHNLARIIFIVLLLIAALVTLFSIFNHPAAL